MFALKWVETFCKKTGVDDRCDGFRANRLHHADLDVLNDAQNGIPAELQPVLNWMENNYIGRLCRNWSRCHPVFPIRMWNVYERTLNGQDQTNNHAEMAHRRLQSVLQMDHPSLCKFIRSLWQMQKERDMLYERMIDGHPPTAKRRKYQDADVRIVTLVHDFANRPLIEYLRGIVHNF